MSSDEYDLVMSSDEYDLVTADGVLHYLEQTPFAATSATLLAGGYTNFTYRLHLKAPYEGHDTVVLKHAEGFSRVSTSFMLGAERLNNEVGTLNRVKPLIPAASFVTVPAVLFHDAKNYAMIMEDCGDVVRLKDIMISEPLSPHWAEAVGKGLGEFLAIIHEKGSQDKELMQHYWKDAKPLEAWRSFGILMCTLTNTGRGAGLIDPPLDLSQAELDEVTKLIDHYSNAIVHDDHQTFAMGDLWPGNILITSHRNTDNELVVDRVWVVDWEMSKPGLQGLDIGQFTAEMQTLRGVYPASTTSTENLMAAFFRGYTGLRRVDIQLVRTAAIYTGVHITNGIPRNDWQTPSSETVRKIALEGVEHILKGASGDEAWLKQSFVRGLIVVKKE